MSKLQQKTTVVLEGRGKVAVRPSDHIATGGEGSVYRVGNTAVKLFVDPRKARRDGMEEKVSLLARIRHPYIVAPKGTVLSSQNNLLGYYMDMVDGEPLSRVFTNDFRTATKFGKKHSDVLVERMRETIAHAHQAHAVLVDANELNWLFCRTSGRKPEPRVIDVDSWSIGRWKTNVIMPSIRDWGAREFSEGSDWFSWGVVTFQVYTGIHPYKGKLDGYTPYELTRRMQDRKSVFTKGVRLNRAVRDFSLVPAPLLDWYVATFEDGERTMPPSPFETGKVATQHARVLHVTTTATGNLVYEKLLGKEMGKAVRVFPSGVVLLEHGELVDLRNKRKVGTLTSREGGLVPVEHGWLKADWVAGKSHFSFISRTNFEETPLTPSIKPLQYVQQGDRLFAVTEAGLTELVLKHFGKPVLSVGRTWNATYTAARWFDGVGVQDAMGATYVTMPFGERACVQVRVPELDNLRVIDARAGTRFAALMALNAQGEYTKTELTFDAEHRTYRVWQGSAELPDLNAAMLPRGVVATVVEDGTLAVFVPATGTLNRITDKDITTDITLQNWDERVVYLKGGEVWSLHMR